MVGTCEHFALGTCSHVSLAFGSQRFFLASLRQRTYSWKEAAFRLVQSARLDHFAPFFGDRFVPGGVQRFVNPHFVFHIIAFSIDSGIVSYRLHVDYMTPGLNGKDHFLVEYRRRQGEVLYRCQNLNFTLRIAVKKFTQHTSSFDRRSCRSAYHMSFYSLAVKRLLTVFLHE